MKITTYKCDVCGADIRGARKSVLIAGIDELGNITESKSIGIDACPGCAERLSDRLIITNPTENRTDPEEEEKYPEPVRRRALDFDLGKAISLRRGGWTLSKIADEMKCSPQTVANYLERAGVIKKKETSNVGEA